MESTAPLNPSAGPPRGTALSRSLAALSRSLALPVAGMGLFGIALRASVKSADPELAHLGWAALLPATMALAWFVCLPAFFVFLAGRDRAAKFALCARGTQEALRIVGACLASTAPMLWFFAVTAPQSRILQPLGIAFTFFAMAAGSGAFGAALKAGGIELSPRARCVYIALVGLVFVRFATGAGIHWFAFALS
ncbi:MAG: hypothetical protein ACOX6T_17940 [Myxococcales bacterium]|jgi:hypothetical protein